MEEETQVLVKFVTKLPAHLRVPATPVAVPSTLKRYGLSQIINHLLALDPARPFDFLVNGELIRRSLEAHLLAHNLSAESTLEVEYVPAVVPPKQKNSTPHDDWVSSVDGSRCTPAASSSGSAAAAPSGVIVSGSYDGLIRLWNGELECTASVSAHAGGVNCVRFLPKSQGSLLLTSGKDRLVKMWQVEAGAAEDGASSSGCRLVATYSGHDDGVECVAPSPSGRRFASCGWDGRLLVWEGGRAVAEAADAEEAAGTAGGAEAGKKKRKVAANGSASAAVGGLSVSEPSAELRGHLHCISAVSWPAEGALFSGGWDHSVRRWDVSAGVATDIYNGSKAVLCVASHGSAPHLVAFGCSDRALRLWDTRGKAGSDTLAVTTHGSHGGWVTSVAWSPASSHLLASASHDGTVKMWDVRTQVPLGTLSNHTDKVLAVGWLGGDGDGDAGQPRALISGGADCQLRMYESEGMLP